MENQAWFLTTDSAIYKRFSPVRQAGYVYVQSSKCKKNSLLPNCFCRCLCSIALEISKLPVVSGRAIFLKQRRLVLLQEPTDTKTGRNGSF